MSENFSDKYIDQTFGEMMGSTTIDVSGIEGEHPMYHKLRSLGYSEDDIREMLGFERGGE